MSFEAFVTKFTNSINDKERAGRTMSDPDIVNAIWDKVQCYLIDHYKSALQVEQFLNPHAWNNVLDTLSAQVSKLSISKPINKLSEVSQSNCYNRDGHCTDNGVHTSDGIISLGVIPRINGVLTQ